MRVRRFQVSKEAEVKPDVLLPSAIEENGQQGRRFTQTLVSKALLRSEAPEKQGKRKSCRELLHKASNLPLLQDPGEQGDKAGDGASCPTLEERCDGNGRCREDSEMLAW